MGKKVRSAGEEMIGWGLLLLAVAVLPLPLIPSLLLIASLLILSSRYQWAKEMLVRARQIFRFPFPGQPSKKIPVQQA